MKKQEIFQVDAFAGELFRGNPAAVCILDSWLPDDLMQSVAAENNLSETAFAVPANDGYEIRWFTPVTEVALCGHATLATAHVLFCELPPFGDLLRFFSRERGKLTVTRDGDWLVLDFPSDPPRPAKLPVGMTEAIGQEPLECMKGTTDYMLVYPDQHTIENLRPDFGLLGQIPARGVIVTAPGREVDFVSRFFAPQSGVDEDPVTGSAHTVLVPYWSGRLKKNTLTARQLSRRGGELRCESQDDRVAICGQAQTYLKGHIYLPRH
ncbi:PhzF family phenazine biosynthesis protein [Robiginitalea sp. SC105]|uniref:PhzF family phenazine biosynthesis protein n=1 Tax=Robiginitalea sp. SC105 TaxID=2762332 RepID=UPI00163B0BB9|nr:PhzF family phenazine biosynthesis protein [Robiginitalea sp. SC105]MBC2838339.1 PhzF family phenazine biosynthesis protein [Robiginitalea sp. SC105]